MAIEFGSRKETFDNFKVYETMLAGRPFKVEMGKMCGLSNASALIRYGETCVMCNVVMSPKPREGVDFFPLNVEYEEKLYAAGRIPGSFMRREGRPGERAILTSRVVDRPMRPLFPKEMRNDVCITMTVMSLDPDCSPEIAGMIGASLVTAVSDIHAAFGAAVSDPHRSSAAQKEAAGGTAVLAPVRKKIKAGCKKYPCILHRVLVYCICYRGTGLGVCPLFGNAVSRRCSIGT